jgi:hypothetical protein
LLKNVFRQLRQPRHLPPRKKTGRRPNERSERLFGYDPDRDVDVWDEYQAAMEDPMFAY